MGFFNGGTFNLTVSLRYVPQTGEIAFLCDQFNRTSSILHDVTDGTHSIETVLSPHPRSGVRRSSVW